MVGKMPSPGRQQNIVKNALITQWSYPMVVLDIKLPSSYFPQLTLAVQQSIFCLVRILKATSMPRPFHKLTSSSARYQVPNIKYKDQTHDLGSLPNCSCWLLGYWLLVWGGLLNTTTKVTREKKLHLIEGQHLFSLCFKVEVELHHDHGNIAYFQIHFLTLTLLTWSIMSINVPLDLALLLLLLLALPTAHLIVNVVVVWWGWNERNYWSIPPVSTIIYCGVKQWTNWPNFIKILVQRLVTRTSCQQQENWQQQCHGIGISSYKKKIKKFGFWVLVAARIDCWPSRQIK